MASLLSFRHATADSPLGPITVVESERGVVKVEFGEADAESLQHELGSVLKRPIDLERRARLRATTELAEYFRRRRHTFGVPLDLSLSSSFQRKVLMELTRVAFGQLVTYGELARRVGKPKAARAIGVAMAKNPIPIIIPCHRVIAADGSLGGFSSGLEVKRRLHDHEGIRPLAGGWEPAARYAS
jgi:methylated-DNA-[protein]-cysteine S-methyltransferase